MRKHLAFIGAAAAVLSALPANAAIVVVDALGNSSSGGTGAASGLTLSPGDIFSIDVDPADLWSAGALPRWSNADGLTGNLFATGSDESGESAGTLIGQDFGAWNQAGLSAPYGSLVGEIGGVYQLLGSNFTGAAWGAGDLNLYYWDSNNADNAGSISANVSLVPEPATWGLLVGGLGLVGAAMRRRARKLKVHGVEKRISFIWTPRRTV